jgi:threonine dehydratase
LAAERLVIEHSGVFIHPSNDPNVISGQGTVGIELIEQVRELANVGELDALIIPIGGGGLCSGVTLAAKALNPSIKIFAAEPEGANDAYRSKRDGRLHGHDEGPPNTIADGLRTCLGSHTWPVVRDLVDAVITVDDVAIADAVRLVYERMKLAIEPSAGVGVAVAMSEEFRGRDDVGQRVGIILCGGNADLDQLPWKTKEDESNTDCSLM